MSHRNYVSGLLLIGIVLTVVLIVQPVAGTQAPLERPDMDSLQPEPAASDRVPQPVDAIQALEMRIGVVEIQCEAPGHVATGFPSPDPATIGADDELGFIVALECTDPTVTAVLSLPTSQVLTFTVSTPVQMSDGLGRLPTGNYEYYLVFSSTGTLETPVVTGTFQITTTNVFLPLAMSNAPAEPGPLVNEVLFEPATITETEWVELYNASESQIDPSDWHLGDQAGDVTTLPDWNWPAGSYLVVHFDDGTNDDDWGDGVGHFYTGDTGEMLSDDQGELALYGPTGAVADFVAWSTTGVYTEGSAYAAAVSQGKWPAGAFVDLSGKTFPPYMRLPMFAAGHSLERIEGIADTNTPDNWRDSGDCAPGITDCPEGATPGAANEHPAYLEVIGEDPGVSAQATKAWTIMWYGSADDWTMELALFRNLNQMEEVGTDDNINLVFMYDGRWSNLGFDSGAEVPNTDGAAWRGYIKRQTPNDWNQVRVYTPLRYDPFLGKVNMGSLTTLSNFVVWAINTFPADRYALIISGHGYGWKGIGWDDTSKDLLTMGELWLALKDMPLDLIGFDACLMATLEVAHQVQPFGAQAFADVMVASEEKEMASGWPYDRFLAGLAANPDWTAAQLGSRIVSDYHNFYSAANTLHTAHTLSAIDLSGEHGLTDLISWFADDLKLGVEDYRAHDNVDDNVQVQIKRDRELSEEFKDVNFIDLWDFANRIHLDGNIPDIYKTQAKPVADLLLVGAGVIITEAHGPGHTDNVHGLSIYFPREQECEEWDCGQGDPFDNPNWGLPLRPCHMYAHDNDAVHGFVPAEHPMPTDSRFAFPHDTWWDEFLIRYYKPVADAGPDKGALVGQFVELSGIGSSDSGQANNVTPEYWYWDFDLTKETDRDDYDRDNRKKEEDDDKDAEKSKPVFPCKAPGDFEVRLMVWDEHYDYQSNPATAQGKRLREHFLPHWNMDDDLVTVHCRLLCKPVEETVPGGPKSLPPRETGTYTATYKPVTATLPVTITWDNGTVSPTATYSWTTPGLHTIKVTATNPCGQAQGTFSVTVSSSPSVTVGNNMYTAQSNLGQRIVYMPSVIKAHDGGNSHLSIQNLTSSDVDIMVTFFALGETTPTHTVTRNNVPAYSSWHLAVWDEANLPDGFIGSAVVSASGLVAVVDTQVRGDISLAYSGFITGATVLYAPELLKNRYSQNSQITVQNLGSTPTTVNVAYSDGVTNNCELAPLATCLLDQQDEEHVDDSIFSAVLTADQPLAALVARVTLSKGEILYKHKALSGGNTVVNLPFTAKESPFGAPTGFGWNSFAGVQNVGDSSTVVTITYKGYEANASSVSIEPGATGHFYSIDAVFLPDGYAGPALLVSDNDQPIVAMVSLARWDLPPGSDSEAIYTPPPVSENRIYYPFAPKSHAGWGATLSVENTGTSSATVTASFYDESGTTYAPTDLGNGVSNPFTLAPGASQLIPLSDIADLPDGVYSVVVSANQPMAGVTLNGAELYPASMAGFEGNTPDYPGDALPVWVR